MDRLPKISLPDIKLQDVTAQLTKYAQGITVEQYIALGTMGTLYLLYKNYKSIHRIKENRKSISGNALVKFCADEEEGDLDCISRRRSSTSRNNDRNLLENIWHLNGLFDNLEGLDRILNVLWFPSVQRGVGFRFGRPMQGNIRPNEVWHYGDVLDKTEKIIKPVLSVKKGLPDGIYYLLKSSRVFGYWNLDDILRLNDFVDYHTYPENEYLFQIGESDDRVYIILSGQIELSFRKDGEDHTLKTLKIGDQIISLLSFIDFMVGKDGKYKTVQAKARETSLVMVVPMYALVHQLMGEPKALSRGVQRALRRAYEVIFTACHQTLGLTKELVGDVQRHPVITASVDLVPLEKPPESLVTEAGAALLNYLQIPEDALLAECSVLVVPPQFVLYEAGAYDEKSVAYVYQGEVEVVFKSFINSANGDDDDVFYVGSGEIFGALAFFTDDPRLFTVSTTVKSVLIIIPAPILKDIIDKIPHIFFPLVDSMLRRLSGFARQMDFGLEWSYVDSGQALFYADDEPTATYLVLSGRLRSFLPTTDDRTEIIPDEMSTVSEYGKYDFVGLAEMWTKRRRTKTVLAVRDTEIAKIPLDLFRYICSSHAKVTFQLVQFLTRKVVSTYKTKKDSTDIFNMEDLKLDRLGSRSTYALFPAKHDVPVEYIAKEFEKYYSQYGSVLTIHAEYVTAHFGNDVFVPGSHSGLTSWLGFLETKYNKILYVADSKLTRWSTKCFHQADMIFIAVNDDGDKDICSVENMILEGQSLARKELLICHRFQEGFPKKMPRYTKAWLERRPWLNFHHHIYISSKFYGLTNDEIAGLGPENFGKNEDIARVVRWLTGYTFGLALGGGGAKGAAHIGFLDELAKTKLPVDMICGVSIGSFIGALFAVYRNATVVEKLARNWFSQTANPKKYIFDLTFPFVSLFTGDSLNFSLIELFGDLQIEDMRIPYFTCTTDLSNNSIREHRCGSLWRYVRASMTLINYFPPICDPRDGHYLIDGGYTNLVPADMMRKLGVRYIMAVDISSKANHYRNTFYGDSLYGLNLISHLTPVFSSVSVPSMLEIQTRLTWAQSVVYLNLIKKMENMERSEMSPSVIYVRLPIDFYSTADFMRFDNIKTIGKNFGKRVFENIQPEDPVDVVWLKLKFNRGNHRFGSIERPFTTSISGGVGSKEMASSLLRQASMEEAPNLSWDSAFDAGHPGSSGEILGRVNTLKDLHLPSHAAPLAVVLTKSGKTNVTS